MTAQAHDPFAEALNPQLPASVTFGQALFDAYFCALIKGQGKVVFDNTQHNPRQRRTCIKVDIVPLPETGQQWDISREFIAEIRTDGWLKVTLPSLRDLGVTAIPDINEKYVKCELVTYGTYTKSDGSEGELSAPKILAIYDTRELCLKAFEADEPERAAVNSDDIPGFPSKSDQEKVDEINEELFGVTPNGAAPVNEGQRKVALGFLPGIVRSCKANDTVDLAALETKLAETPLIKDHFNMASPEVLDEVRKVMGETAF